MGHCGTLPTARLVAQPTPASQQPPPLSLPGVILPGETKNFTFFFKSLNAGIFRESWEFGTHPTLLGGAVLQVTLHAISLTQDIFMDERKLLEVRDSESPSRVGASGADDRCSGVEPPILRGDFSHHAN